MTDPLVTIITPTIGNPQLFDCVLSVCRQSYKNIQHLIVLDGFKNHSADFYKIAEKCHNDILSWEYKHDLIELPYSTGADRYNGHRIYGASIFLAKGDFVMFLDEDNWIDPNHVQSLVDQIRKGNDWAYSLRKIVNQEGHFLCNDDCESLGKWPSILHDQDFFVDVNCYFLPKMLAVHTASIWHRKFREPGQMEVDRALIHTLNLLKKQDGFKLKAGCTGEYTVNYRVGSTGLSVQPDFFLQGNELMSQHYHGKLPWQDKDVIDLSGKL